MIVLVRRDEQVSPPSTARFLWILALLAAPQAIALWLAPPLRDVADAAAVSSVATYGAMLMSSLLYYFYWRMTDGNPTAWLNAGLVLVGVQGLAWAALVAADPHSIAAPGWLLLVDLLTSGVLLVMMWAATRPVMLSLDPLVVGLLGGAVLALIRILLHESATPLTLSRPVLVAGVCLLVALQLLVAGFLLRLPTAPGWVRHRLVAATVLIVLGHALHYGDPIMPVAGVVAIVTGTVGMALLAWTAATLLRRAIREQFRVLHAMEGRLLEAETGIREGRARMHEIGATVAGIASASNLMRRRHALTWERRQQLERMVESELARLERLMGARELMPPHVFLLDSTLEPLVVAHRAQGHPVQWTATGSRAVGRPDDLAEVVNILLTNAARHGGVGGTRLHAHHPHEGVVEIVVSDSGPGVSAALRRRLFEWGTRGPESNGQGIGLHIAQQLMADQSGSLELADSTGPGATFVVRLPGIKVRQDQDQ